MHEYIHTYIQIIHTYRSYIHTDHTYIHTYIKLAYIHTHVQAYKQHTHNFACISRIWQHAFGLGEASVTESCVHLDDFGACFAPMENKK